MHCSPNAVGDNAWAYFLKRMCWAFGVLNLEDSDGDETFSRLRRGMEKALEETYMNKQLPTFLSFACGQTIRSGANRHNH